MSTDENYMLRAIELADRAAGATSPNPLVGAVIVRDDSIIGEGWHKCAGQAHAEIEALHKAGARADGATLYITLEPCAHHGRTPPCVEAILNAGIKTVVYAIADPNRLAAGGGTRLRSEGIKVVSGICAAQAQHLNRFFLHFMKTGNPYVIAKFASSLDGRVATRTGHSQWITGSVARMRGHQLRQCVDAILVGAQTVIDDDPQLTTRLANTLSNDPDLITVEQHPLRIILDSRGRIPLHKKVVSGELPGSTLVITTDAMPAEHRSRLCARNIEVLQIASIDGPNQIDLPNLLRELGDRSIQSLLVEGGRTVHGAFFDAHLVQEVWAFVAPILIGGNDALPAIGGLGIDKLPDALRLTQVVTEQLNEDLLIRGHILSQSEIA